MKKITRIIALVFILSLMLSFAACGEDDSQKDTLVGTWVQKDDKYGDLTITIDADNNYTFKQGGTSGSGKIELDEENKTAKVFLIKDYEVFNYTLDGDKLELKSDKRTLELTRE